MKESSNLDFLRACAVSLVLLDHTLKFHGIWDMGGFHTAGVLGGVGVALFFVHTCLVLMMSMERHQTRFQGTGLVGSFYVRRFFRIYPLSVVAVLAVVFFRIPARSISTGMVHLSTPSFGDVISNLFLMQNVSYHDDVLGVLWSLPLEVQMYLVLPPLFLLVWRWGTRWQGLLALWCVAVGLAFVQPLITARLNVFQYVPHFLPGVIAYALLKHVQPRLPAWLWPIWLVTLTVAVIVSGYKHAEWFMCLALGLSIPLFREISLTPVRRISFWMAKYSYGEYLSHVMCIWFAFQYLGHIPVAAQWIVFVLMVVGIPVLLFHALEAPMIRVGARLADRWFAKPAPQVIVEIEEPISLAQRSAG
jgi:peptidoglycan/LPS O-acetylase OafA/YrhL